MNGWRGELSAALHDLPHAVTVTEELRGPRELVLRIDAPGGAFTYVDFDGETAQPGTWVVTWNTSVRMATSMGAVNPHHGCKATRVFYSFSELVAGLCQDAARFADDSAYAAPSEVSTCAKCGRPWEPWPLNRPALCAPAHWKSCIHPTQGRKERHNAP